MKLIEAVKQNNKEEVTKLLSQKPSERGFDINAVDEELQGSALWWSACLGYDHFIRILVEAGADVNKCDKEGGTPVLIAAYRGHVNIINQIHALSADVNKSTNDGKTPVYVAAENGHADAIKVLHTAAADTNTPDKNGITPICIAVFNGHFSAVNCLLDCGVDERLKTPYGTLLEIATQNNHTEIIELLEEKPPKSVARLINRGDYQEAYNYFKNFPTPPNLGIKTAIMLVTVGELKALEKFLGENPDIIAKTMEGNTLLHFAARAGHGNFIEFLISKGCDLNATNERRETPLHIAMQFGHSAFSKTFLSFISRQNLDKVLEVENKNGHTPVQVAIIQGHKEPLELLLTYKVSLQHQDKRGQTILHLGVLYNLEALSFLLNHPLLPSDFEMGMPDENGQTALHLASEKGSVPAVQLLCSKGAPLETVDNKGITPLYRAISSGHLDVVKVLVSFGANRTNVLAYAEKCARPNIVGYLKTYELQQGDHEVKKSKICNLVFQGGSVKGIAYLGALEKLEEKGILLKEMQRISGTSAGAITATLLGVGYKIPDTQKILDKLDFKDLLDSDKNQSFLAIKDLIEKNTLMSWAQVVPHSGNIISFINKLKVDYGIFKGEFLRTWIEDLIFLRTKTKNTTFRELAALKEIGGNPQDFKHIYLIGTNVSTGATEVFSHEHTPDMIIADAVRISMSIPLLFVPHQRYDKVNNQRTLISNHRYIDGGVTENYPLWLFDNSKYLENTQGLGLSQINQETLGFRLVPWNTKVRYEQQQAPDSKDIDGLISFIFSIINCYLEKQESEHARQKESLHRTIYIDTVGVSMLDFNLTEENKRNLMNAGYRAADEYFVRIQTLDKKVSLSRQLLASLVKASKNPLLIQGEKGIEIKGLELNSEMIPKLIYKFYLNGTDSEKEFLDSLKININAQDKEGNTAAHYAVRDQQMVCLNNLIQKNAKLNIVNNNSETVLDLACVIQKPKKRNEMVSTLLKRGASIVGQEKNIKIIQDTGEILLSVLKDDMLKARLKKVELSKINNSVPATFEETPQRPSRTRSPLSASPPLPEPTMLLSFNQSRKNNSEIASPKPLVFSLQAELLSPQLKPLINNNYKQLLATIPQIKQATPQVVAAFVRLIAEGEQNQAEALLQKDATLTLLPSDVTDLSGRTFQGITGLQYSIWALDWHMWTMILKYLPNDQAAEQIKAMDKGSWVSQHRKSGDWLIQNLLDALQTYINLCNQSKWSEAELQWKTKVGGAQRLLPVHVINEYCHPNRPFYPCPDFTKSDPLPRTRKLDVGEWFAAVYNCGKLGEKFAVLRQEGVNGLGKRRGLESDGMWGRSSDWGAEWRTVVVGLADREACHSLLATRTQQRDQLVAELSISKRPSNNIN